MKQTNIPQIRLAVMIDRPQIHEAHMRSIREVSIKDHGPEEVRGWGNRELGERWISGIEKGRVWVIEFNEQISGVGYIDISDKNGKTSAHVYAMYLTPEVIGLGFAKRMMNLMLDLARSHGALEITLDSSLTAHGFYQKFGFVDSGPLNFSDIGGSQVRSYPMKLILNP
ncbi:MAG: GNAT family N-acetyltransferase [Proteobacteria bacterium]|nr:GNAT family N-acetyltransferase [Pseudomonadota bacterium]